MTIDQINKDQHLVMFGANSITVKSRDTGKTVGVIRNARRLSSGTRNARQDFDALEKLRKAGLDWRAISVDRLVLADNALYIFVDRRISDLKQSNPALYEIDNAGGRMDARIAADSSIVAAANAAGLPVIEYLPFRIEDGHNYR